MGGEWGGGEGGDVGQRWESALSSDSMRLMSKRVIVAAFHATIDAVCGQDSGCGDEGGGGGEVEP